MQVEILGPARSCFVAVDRFEQWNEPKQTNCKMYPTLIRTPLTDCMSFNSYLTLLWKNSHWCWRHFCLSETWERICKSSCVPNTPTCCIAWRWNLEWKATTVQLNTGGMQHLKILRVSFSRGRTFSLNYGRDNYFLPTDVLLIFMSFDC